jgi:hypothetical protein
MTTKEMEAERLRREFLTRSAHIPEEVLVVVLEAIKTNFEEPLAQLPLPWKQACWSGRAFYRA